MLEGSANIQSTIRPNIGENATPHHSASAERHDETASHSADDRHGGRLAAKPPVPPWHGMTVAGTQGLAGDVLLDVGAAGDMWTDMSSELPLEQRGQGKDWYRGGKGTDANGAEVEAELLFV